MTGVGHLITGGVVVSTILIKADTTGLVLFSGIGIGLFGSVFPDIDAQNSLLQVLIVKRNPTLSNHLFNTSARYGIVGGLLYSLFAAIELSFRLLAKTIFDLVKVLTPHRGIIHSLSGVIFISSILFFINLITNNPLILTLAFVVGYLVHLCGDLVTKSGLRLLAPFSNNVYHLLPNNLLLAVSSKSGSKEAFYVLIVILFCVVALFLV
jgi:membrane-bound metal-dependent hydrolase YbcI (DUF457 family)